MLQGFNTYLQDGIVLQVSTNPQINVSLEVGAVSEQITVTANATMVETHSTGIGQVIDNQRVAELPLNGRVATELIFLAGLATSAPAGDLNTNKNYPTQTISVAGGQANGITYIMDGGTHNDPFNNLNLPAPFPDALQEFKVETSALPARYGHHAASAVNIITKSGTNSFKGSTSLFNRNYRFNARNAFALERDSLKRNQFGGVLGGPIAKNRAFFFGGYQGRIERSNPSTTFSWVPTTAMINGDFSAFASPACNQGRQVTLTGGFVNNQIDPSRLNPVALNFAKYLPTAAADPCGRVQYGIQNNNTEHQTIARGDYTLSNRQQLLARYLYSVYENPATFDGQNVLTLSRTGQKNQAHSLVVGHNFLLSASLINSLRATYNTTINDRPLPEYFTATDLGSRIYSPLAGYVGVSVTGNGFAVGAGGTNPGYFDSESFQLADDVDWLLGDHQLSFGGNWIHTKIETLNNRPTNGAFTFNGQSTGLSLADFMLGAVSGGFLQGNPVYDYDNHDYIGAYIQDDWKVRPNLSLNFGVRWEPFIPLRNTFGWVSHFDKSRFDQGLKSRVYPQAPAGLIFPGDDDYPGDATTHGKLGMFAPRVGMIWTPGSDNNTSVRAAWGVFYDTPHLFFNTRFANNPAVGRADHDPESGGRLVRPVPGLSRRQPVPRAQRQLGYCRVPGVWRLREHADQPGAHDAPAVERQRAAAIRRAAPVGELPGQSHVTLVARDRAQPGGIRRRRHDRQHQPAPRADPAERRRRTALRHYRSCRRYRPRQLQRPAGVGAAAVAQRPQHPVELDHLQVHVGSSDDGDHGADDCRSQQPGSRLLVLFVRSPSRDQRVGGRADARVLEPRAQRGARRLAGLAARAMAERQSLVDHDRRGQRVERYGRPARGADPRRPVRRRLGGQLSEPGGVHVAGVGHLQRPDSVQHREPVASEQRPGGHQNLPPGHHQRPVPLGNLQRDQSRKLQPADDGPEQRELRPDLERGRSANHAVRIES